jgi:SAM-dependent methyltransferase
MMDPRKKLVRDCYDAVGDAYGESRRRTREPSPDEARERGWYERFVAMLPSRGRVLDLGCGNGDLYLADLRARGFRTVGVDLSHRQAVCAHARCPDVFVVEGDAAEIEFADAAFDGILSYHAIFHLPWPEHAAVFARVRRWLVDGGTALLTLGAIHSDGDGGLFTDLLGVPTFYDARTADTSLQLLRDAGFAIVDHDRPDLAGVLGGTLIVLARAR